MDSPSRMQENLSDCRSENPPGAGSLGHWGEEDLGTSVIHAGGDDLWVVRVDGIDGGS